MNKLIEDLSTITTISEGVLNGLNDKAILCICHSVFEQIREKESLTRIDIGVGILYINCEGDNVKYKFIPSKKLEESVDKTISTNKSPLVLQVDNTLRERLSAAYKNLI